MSWDPRDDETFPPRRVASQHCDCEMCTADPAVETELTVEDTE